MPNASLADPDPYYPPEEAAEREALVVPALAGWEGDVAVLTDPGSAEARPLAVGGQAWGWTAAARLRDPDLLVLERRFRRWGVLAYVGAGRPPVLIRKAVGELAALAEPRPEPPAGRAEQVLASGEDLLGKDALAQGEPSYATVAAQLPELVSYTFLGVPERAVKVAVESDGTLGPLPAGYGPSKRIEQPLFEPKHYVPQAATHAKRGLLGRHLPAIDYGFLDATTDQGWEELALCAPAGGAEAPGTLLVALRTPERWRFFALDPLDELPDGARFFRALLDLHHHWEGFFREGMQVRLPEPRLEDACRAAIARARSTYHGDRPKYGLGGYSEAGHDGFPPTTLFTVGACIEWGLRGQARSLLDYYLDRFVRPVSRVRRATDGTFDYYGPAVSEYGQFLALAARFVRVAGGGEWLRGRLPKLRAVAEHLLRLRRESLAASPAGSPHRGLLFGSPEADTREQVNHYYSGSAWAWRGLLELGRHLAIEQDAEVRAFGASLLAECASLREDVLRSMEAALVPGKPPFLPPYPGLTEPFASMTCSGLASYTNYRYWPEMLSAGLLPEALAAALMDYRRERGGEVCGTTRFEGQMDDWPLAHHAWGLLAADRVDAYLLALCGHLALHQTPGTFTAYEQVHVRGAGHRTYAADYCVPAQLTVPLMARWVLLFEEPDAERLWLCRATPRRWLAPGSRFSVERAPTRWGPIGFSVEAEGARVAASLEMPQVPPAEVVLRLRRPGGQVPTRVLVSGRQVPFDAGREAVVLPAPSGRVSVEAAYAG